MQIVTDEEYAEAIVELNRLNLTWNISVLDERRISELEDAIEIWEESNVPQERLSLDS